MIKTSELAIKIFNWLGVVTRKFEVSEDITCASQLLDFSERKMKEWYTSGTKSYNNWRPGPPSLQLTCSKREKIVPSSSIQALDFAGSFNEFWKEDKCLMDFCDDRLLAQVSIKEKFVLTELECVEHWIYTRIYTKQYVDKPKIWEAWNYSRYHLNKKMGHN